MQVVVRPHGAAAAVHRRRLWTSTGRQSCTPGCMTPHSTVQLSWRSAGSAGSAGTPKVAMRIYLGQRQQALLPQRLEGAHEALIPGVPDVVAVAEAGKTHRDWFVQGD